MGLARTISFGLSKNHAGVNLEAWPALLSSGVSAALGSPVVTALADDYDALINQVLAGAVDVAWLPPLLHARAAEQGARLVALPQRGGWLTFRSALLVRKDDPIDGPANLRGARVAWRDRASASGYLFPRIELAALGATPDKAFSSEKFYGSVVDAAQAVASGAADLCTCWVSDPAARDRDRAMVEIEKALGPELAGKLRVLHVTDPIPPDGLVVAAQVQEAERSAIATALLALHTTPQGQKALQTVFQAERLAPVNDALLRSLKTWAEAAAARGA
ncbi:MAG: phosphate/phosphite/phosphonate ABC transporter substrate-binding protein [Myxococcales bacterium]|nr:phosphate/phosphite/phosphonate ABC transporter substrate-binding protein [Myxococcales bacterium]